MLNNTIKIALCLCLGLATRTISAQVGIGITVPNAALDITATDNGLLIPRLALSATNIATVITPTKSELVYNTFNSAVGPNQVTEGFYYWNGTIWVQLAAGDAWSLTGNSGTTSATNFLGTTDNVDLVIRSNNTERIRVAANGLTGINENNPTDATLEIGGNLIVGNTYTGGNAIAQTGGMTVEGRTIIGDDDFFYDIDKLVVYGNTNWIATGATNGDNGNTLTYAVNGYTSDGVAIYGEDNDGGIGVSANVRGSSSNRAIGVSGYDTSGTGYGMRGIGQDNTATTGYVGVQGVETTITNFAIVASGDLGYTAGLVNLSDKRLKENIKPIKNALGIIDQINPKNYDMKWEQYKSIGLARTPQMGFIAQELEQVLPNLVSDKTIPLNDHIYSKEELTKNPELNKKKGSDMDVKMVNYVQMVPLLTQAIKEQQILIKKLEARIFELEK